jgi:protein-S-isoprenylcysteine O-methyltransferase Ste14
MTTLTSTPMKRTHLPNLGPRGEGWVVLQLLLFAVVIGTGFAGPLWSGAARAVGAIAGGGLVVAGFAFVSAGVLALRQQLTAFPMPVLGGRLIEDGVFGLVRHPMYGGGVIAALGWGLFTASPMALASALILLAFFDLKSRREEAWLGERYAAYAAYRRHTRRLIPWLY